MNTTKRLEIDEITGTWILTIGDKSTGYSQHPSLKDHFRLVKDILKCLELQNVIEIKER